MATLGKLLAPALFVLVLPVFIFLANLLWVVLDVGTYERAFFDYGAAARTGLSADELRIVAAALVAHFWDGTPIALTVAQGAQRVPLFTEREIIHLQDVHDLVRLGLIVLGGMAAYFVLFATAGVRWWRGRYVTTLARYVLRGAALTLGVLGGLAILTLFSFDQLFLTFHVVSFPNDFWILDPSQHYLINLFAQDFFFASTLRVAGMAAVQAVLLALVTGIVIWWRDRHGPAGQESRSRADG